MKNMQGQIINEADEAKCLGFTRLEASIKIKNVDKELGLNKLKMKIFVAYNTWVEVFPLHKRTFVVVLQANKRAPVSNNCRHVCL